jgi:hypothetical protein
MASNTRKQTMAKLARQRALQEKREAKQLKKEERRRAAAEGRPYGAEAEMQAEAEAEAEAELTSEGSPSAGDSE